MKTYVLTFTLIALLSTNAFAHEGHDDGADEIAVSGEIVLSDAMMANLGITSVPAVMQEVSKTIDLPANIDYLPERQAIVSSRAQGTISKILIWTGQKVSKGQDVLIMQPLFIGNPPITLKSPIDGYVTEQNVVIGQAVNPDQPLVRIADLSEVYVRGLAYENTAQIGFAIGQPVTATTPNLPGEVFKGTVHHIDATLQAGSRVREIDSVVANPDGKLLANMQATLSIAVGEQAAALLVPQRAVLGDTGSHFVYVQKGDHFYRREVTLGEKYGNLREITHGVSVDEHVVTIGNYQLQFITPSKSSGEADDHGHDH